MAAGHGIDEYLETIYFLAFPIGEYRPQATGSQTIASRVAEMLGVSRASAGEMLKRLEAEGLVERGEHKEALLTPAGTERARKVVRKHRIIERLLTDFMGYTAGEAHNHADELGGTFTDDMVERIDEKLGHPERCPHGWPVDPDVEQAENRELEPLSALAPGSVATIVRLASRRGPSSRGRPQSPPPASSASGWTAASGRSASAPRQACSSGPRPRAETLESGSLRESDSGPTRTRFTGPELRHTTADMSSSM
jgi:DtxR family transcriptional regulator, Mn-dependent transcriptional regulator